MDLPVGKKLRKEVWAKRETRPWVVVAGICHWVVPQGKYGGGTDKAGEGWTNENGS
jgi:hypothetical protein